MLSYRVILDVPLPLAAFVSRLLAARRRELGTRIGTRALTCWKQAVFALAVEQGLPYLILDGTLISSDRCADKKTSRKGKEIDTWYSGKAHEPAGNVQALAAPGGVPLWVSDVLPGSTHDLTAARELVLPGARPLPQGPAVPG